MKEKQQKKKIVRIIACSGLVLILIILLAAGIFIKDLLSDVKRLDNNGPTLSSEEIENILNQTDGTQGNFTGPELNGNDVVTPTGPANKIEDNANINILLVGQDRRKGEPRMHSDAMILVTINKSSKTLTMTSFMRDLWVQIPGYYKQRLNVPYLIDKVNGFDLLNKTLEYNFGVSAEHNVEVDFSGFAAAIDAVGGVDIVLTGAEARHLNGQQNWNLIEGSNHLTGAQALAYSRIRKIGDDFQRTSRQRTVLTALIEKAKTVSFAELYAMTKSVLPLLTTDMSDKEILDYVIELAKILPELKVVSQRIPADGAYYNAKIDGNQVLCLTEEDWETNKQLLKETLAKD